jgi:hypothetical protein
MVPRKGRVAGTVDAPRRDEQDGGRHEPTVSREPTLQRRDTRDSGTDPNESSVRPGQR